MNGGLGPQAPAGPGRSPGLPSEFAPAKVNLFLHVLGRRADGYHLLDSLAVFAGVGDRLTAEPAASLSLAITGPFGAGLSAGADNLVLRAARALGSGGARLVLDKHLPVASGIGGGSADAAATLRLLARLWRLDVSMEATALSLGADVPVCLGRRTARMGGIGEALAPAPTLPKCGLLLVNPGMAVATADVFRARSGGFSAPAVLPASWPNAEAMAGDLRAATVNDLQAPALALCPLIGAVLAAIEAAGDCLLARMSGSGATCFGLYRDAAAAEAARARLPALGWWSWAGGLFGEDDQGTDTRAGG
jgi:4-diphosphocytidyl-2-C-methyl-D-erythritol kinase